MIYLISDPHGGESMEGIKGYLERCKDDDLLIILGDLGLNFQKTEENRRFTEWFLSLNRQIAIVEGNHENHAYIQSFPEEEWQGGMVHRLTDTIVHLQRGNVYTIAGKTFFVMGGCRSSAKWKEMGLWYPGEEPTEEELELAYSNLQKQGNWVDYVLTHKYGNYRGERGAEYPHCSLEGLIRYIDENVVFEHWYAGHSHINKVIDESHQIVYDEPVVVF